MISSHRVLLDNLQLTLVYNALEPDDREQSASNSCCRNGAEDDETKETSSIPSTLAFQKDLSTRYLVIGDGHGVEDLCRAVQGLDTTSRSSASIWTIAQSMFRTTLEADAWHHHLLAQQDATAGRVSYGPLLKRA